jgi:hypothetical protein
MSAHADRNFLTRRAPQRGSNAVRVRVAGAGAIVMLSLIAARASAGSESAPESARSATPAAPTVELDSVRVEAQRRRARIDREVSEFVNSIVGSAKAESLARWKVPICVAAAGLTQAEAAFVKERVSRIATDAGVPLGRSDCAPNFIVVVTPDPQALLEGWWSEEHQLFNRDRGLGGVNRMIRTDQPVRVWHNACNVPPGLAYAWSGQLDCGHGQTGSRLTWDAVRAIYSAIVVVDFDDIEGLTFGQIADYVAMVGLAKIRKDSEFGVVPTILDLFGMDGADRPKGLTAWDQSLLKAVYATLDGSVTEVSQIKVRMGDDLAR